jgi:hypothetical protein
MRGLKDVENNLQQLKVNSRRHRSNNRGEWATDLEEGRVLGGL